MGSFPSDIVLNGTVPTVLTETVAIETLDGITLTAETQVPDGAWGSLAMCHPHPLYGGDMHNPVVTSVVHAAAEIGLATIRFNFRGVGLSGGNHDHGVGEQLDALAALQSARELATGPSFLAGYSFGGLVALSVDDPTIAGWISIAPPLQGRRGASADSERPKLIIGPAHDQFTPNDVWQSATADWNATEVSVLASADHFLAGHLAAVTSLATAFCERLRPER